MTDIQIPDPTQAPAVPPAVRTAAYYTALVVGALGTAAIAVSAAVAPEYVTQVAAISGAATGAIATIAGGLGVVYRPRTGQAESGRNYTDSGHYHAPTD